MSKKATSKKVSVSKKSASLKNELLATLKCDAVTLDAIANLEKTLQAQKQAKESAKQKVTRQKMRNRKFYRHEHSKETIEKLQTYAKSL